MADSQPHKSIWYLFGIFNGDPGPTTAASPDCEQYSHASAFQIVATQLCSIREPCKIEDLIFKDTSYIKEKDYEESRDYCKMIDEVLTSDNFPSLRSVRLYEEIPFDYFPTLQSRKLLSVCF